MTGKELGDELGAYSSMFTPEQLSALASGQEVEHDPGAGMFALAFEDAETLQGQPIDVRSLYPDEKRNRSDGKCDKKGVKVACLGDGSCCLYFKLKNIWPPKPVFSVCCE